MRIMSNGVLTKSPSIIQTFTPRSFNGWVSGSSGFHWDAYSSIYSEHLWVAVLVNKIANANARLPLKVYERDALNRPEAEGPYAELLRRPSPTIDPYLFWLWTISTLNIFGESFWLKERDAGGRPVALHPMHPTKVINDDGDWFLNVTGQRVGVKRRDLVSFRTFNPVTLERGASPLEPLRSTLENEYGARRANSALWRNGGGRPGVLLSHPKNLSEGASQRIKVQWDEIHGGVDNWAKTAVLEEGMTATTVPVNVDDLQYIEVRKLNREEACAAYDVPPPVVHILDRATFSNITEQMRSMYRDTMAPKLKLVESTLETELRDGSMGEGSPDFGGNVYAEFLLDEVLRGDFEARADALSKADYLTIAEKRQIENKPFIDGTDRIFVNAAQVPLEADTPVPYDGTARVADYAALIRAGVTPSAAAAAVGLPPMEHTGLPPVTVQAEPLDLRSVMGRLSRSEHLADIDPDALVAGMPAGAPLVRSALHASIAEGLTVPEFRERLKALGG